MEREREREMKVVVVVVVRFVSLVGVRCWLVVVAVWVERQSREAVLSGEQVSHPSEHRPTLLHSHSVSATLLNTSPCCVSKFTDYFDKVMPAARGDGMRGLAVFISDIRNCKSRLVSLCVYMYVWSCLGA